MSWSGGKDSSLALYDIMRENKYTIVDLHTTFNEETGRVGMHGIKQDLIEQQADSMGIPLKKIIVPSATNNDAYEKAMSDFYSEQVKEGVEAIVFGDIFLEDLKKYRLDLLKSFGLSSIFPIWKKDSLALAKRFSEEGFKAKICCVNHKYLEQTYLGDELDFELMSSFPQPVDPCGENGEFHSFVYEGPIFKWPIQIREGDRVIKSYESKLADDKVESFSFGFLEILAV